MKSARIAAIVVASIAAFACRAPSSSDSAESAVDSAENTSDARFDPRDSASSTVAMDRTAADRSAARRAADGVLQIGDARIAIEFEGEPTATARAEIERWVRECAGAIATYYGRFPVARATITIELVDGTGIGSGVTHGFDGQGWIRIEVGTRTPRADFAHDWVLTHEMVHLALPDLPSAHHWLEEGSATYIEAIARSQAGLESAEEMWKQLVEGLPQGLPKAGDRGLDGTTSWGRTYWGGALFCLLADIDIRERTHGRFGLQDALAGIVASGFDLTRAASIGDVLARGDAAVGVTALSELYARMAVLPATADATNERTDLKSLWQKLGISMRRGVVRFDDSAPLASVRRAITKAP